MQTLRLFFKLLKPFWLDKNQWQNCLLLILMMTFALSIIRISVWITNWNKDFYDALATFNGAIMPKLILEFVFYMILIVTCVVCGNWLRKVLVFRWREHLTNQFQNAWLSHHQHYHLQNTHHQIDNPDQRIAEDIYLLTDRSIDLFKYFIMNIAKLIAFVTILWHLSGIQTLQLGQTTIQVHGYLVWVALIYSIICTLLMHWLGHHLQTINIERQHREADYRAGLLRVREYSEQIALYQGESHEDLRLKNYFQSIKHNWRDLINREFKVEIFSAAYLRISLFIPIFATLPMYLARTMTFGDVMQARSAFSNVQDGFGWFMDYYKRLIEWAAIVERLATFQAALNNSPATPHIQQTQSNNRPPKIHIQDLNIYTPQGRNLFQHFNLNIHGNQWLLIDGQSGIGKSTLLKTIAGLWQHHQGSIQIQSQSTLFLPQKPYLPIGSLRSVLCYPNTQTSDTETLQHTLIDVGLANLINELDHISDWQKRLSGGEQQRISLARVLLQKPQLIFLDEATNQLDSESALILMHKLKSALPNSLCIGITHQENIKNLFTSSIHLGIGK